MKTLQEIKNTYAKVHGFECWIHLSDLVSKKRLDHHWAKVCILAQKQFQKNIMKKLIETLLIMSLGALVFSIPLLKDWLISSLLLALIAVLYATSYVLDQEAGK